MLFERPEIGESAVLVSVELDRFAAPDLDELVELSKSAGLYVAQASLIKRDRAHAKWLSLIHI